MAVSKRKPSRPGKRRERADVVVETVDKTSGPRSISRYPETDLPTGGGVLLPRVPLDCVLRDGGGCGKLRPATHPRQAGGPRRVEAQSRRDSLRCARPGGEPGGPSPHTQAAAENSSFTKSAAAVLSATAVGAIAGFVFYLWGQRQELQAVEGRKRAAAASIEEKRSKARASFPPIDRQQVDPDAKSNHPHCSTIPGHARLRLVGS